MSYDTNIQHDGDCNECRSYENRLRSANSDIKSLKDSNAELLEALTRIRHPMQYLKLEADKEGNQLDGQSAALLCNSATFLKSIAEEALSKFQPKKP